MNTSPKPPRPRLPTSVTETGFTGNWRTATGASGYRLDVATTSDFSTYVTGYQGKNVGDVTLMGRFRAFRRQPITITGSARFRAGATQHRFQYDSRHHGWTVPGCHPEIQDGAPNDGDGNGDGIKDRLQATSGVTARPHPRGASYLTVEITGCGQLSNVTASTYASVGQTDPGYDYPFDLVGFTIPLPKRNGQNLLPWGERARRLYYRKFGPTPGNWNKSLWYNHAGHHFRNKGHRRQPPLRTRSSS